MALDRIKDLLATCSAQDKSQYVFPPTTLYNEGWMLRLVLDWFSRAKLQNNEHQLCIPEGEHWYSEAILRTKFKAIPLKDLPDGETSDKLAETHTHADGAIGRFTIGGTGKGDLVLKDSTRIIILEAKMYSPLSAGIKNVKDYNQAARIVACMANTLSLAKRKPSSFDQIGFYLILPKENAGKPEFTDKMKIDVISKAIKTRKDQYVGRGDYSDKHNWFEEYLEPMVKKLDDEKTIGIISWDSILEFIKKYDKDDSAETIKKFYEECKKHNGR